MTSTRPTLAIPFELEHIHVDAARAFKGKSVRIKCAYNCRVSEKLNTVFLDARVTSVGTLADAAGGKEIHLGLDTHLYFDGLTFVCVAVTLEDHMHGRVIFTDDSLKAQAVEIDWLDP